MGFHSCPWLRGSCSSASFRLPVLALPGLDVLHCSALLGPCLCWQGSFVSALPLWDATEFWEYTLQQCTQWPRHVSVLIFLTGTRHEEWKGFEKAVCIIASLFNPIPSLPFHYLQITLSVHTWWNLRNWSGFQLVNSPILLYHSGPQAGAQGWAGIVHGYRLRAQGILSLAMSLELSNLPFLSRRDLLGSHHFSSGEAFCCGGFGGGFQGCTLRNSIK